MKATGMTRPVDELGRVVIPKELRKYSSGCDVDGCKEVDGTHEFGGMKFCDKHWEGLKEIARKEMGC